MKEWLRKISICFRWNCQKSVIKTAYLKEVDNIKSQLKFIAAGIVMLLMLPCTLFYVIFGLPFNLYIVSPLFYSFHKLDKDGLDKCEKLLNGDGNARDDEV